MNCNNNMQNIHAETHVQYVTVDTLENVVCCKMLQQDLDDLITWSQVFVLLIVEDMGVCMCQMWADTTSVLS